MKWLPSLVIGYGVIMIALGLYAFVKDGSWKSLAGGGAIGVIAIGGAFLARSHPNWGFGLASLATVAALGKFGPTFIAKTQIYPAGIIVGLSAITLACLVIGHFIAASPAK